jgi:hypothetical protein
MTRFFQQYFSQSRLFRELLADSSALLTAGFLAILIGVTISFYHRHPREARLLLVALGLAIFSDYILNRLHLAALENYYAVTYRLFSHSAQSFLWESVRVSVELIRLICRGFTAWLIMTAAVPQQPTPDEEAA